MEAEVNTLLSYLKWKYPSEDPVSIRSALTACLDRVFPTAITGKRTRNTALEPPSLTSQPNISFPFEIKQDQLLNKSNKPVLGLDLLMTIGDELHEEQANDCDMLKAEDDGRDANSGGWTPEQTQNAILQVLEAAGESISSTKLASAVQETAEGTPPSCSFVLKVVEDWVASPKKCPVSRTVQKGQSFYKASPARGANQQASSDDDDFSDDASTDDDDVYDAPSKSQAFSPEAADQKGLSLEDSIYQILKEEKAPLHIKQIHELIVKRGLKCSARRSEKDQRWSLNNAAKKSRRITRVAPAVYSVCDDKEETKTKKSKT
eukprot:TRINITY_DN17466_c0_g1_i1.p1 TRINITY_DN17466_c0_g1~~TRINITY_DN17466_c0_g1_i1.p1  ORF type:complete len:327 (+),score=72.64 TRINITY_DN17466_c0_g1_i1:26-982(+)